MNPCFVSFLCVFSQHVSAVGFVAAGLVFVLVVLVAFVVAVIFEAVVAMELVVALPILHIPSRLFLLFCVFTPNVRL